MRLRFPIFLATFLLLGCSTAPRHELAAVPSPRGESIRFAVFNILELSTDKLIQTDREGLGSHPQVVSAARIVQAVRPDVIAVLEIDHDYTSGELDLMANPRRLVDLYLNVGENPIDYPHIYVAPNNTGIPSGADLDGNGMVATMDDVGTRDFGNDCYGYGNYPGQYSMVLLSRYPIDVESARTFQTFLWKDMPNSLMTADLYPAGAVDSVRLSSKSHWDVPILVDGQAIHALISHPTPQGFDGREDRNGRRNHDEIRLWADYLSGADYLVDDAGRAGGFPNDGQAVVLGDLNAGLQRGSKFDGRFNIEQLLNHPRLHDTVDIQTSAGAPADVPAATHDGGSRIDYAIPTENLTVTGGGVYWPSAEQDFLGAVFSDVSSDHRLVWIDVAP